MSDPQYFVWLAVQSLSGFAVMWPLVLVLLICIVAATVYAIRRRLLSRETLLWVLIPATVPVAILAWGVIFKNEGPGVLAQPLSWEMAPIILLFLLSLAIGTYATWRAKDTRLLVGSTSALFSLFAFWAGFLAGMSVTGDWI